MNDNFNKAFNNSNKGMNEFDPDKYKEKSYALDQNTLMRRVYVWMSIGLVISGIIAVALFSSPGAFIYYAQNPWLVYGALIAQFALVIMIGMGANSQKISGSAMTIFFIVYSALMGISLSGIFAIYTQESIFGVFFITAATFLAMSFYGYTTKSDLSQIGSFLVMGLIGIIIASVVNIFLKSSAMETIISFIGVIIFVGLTAYDTQKIKAMSENMPEGSESYKKASIMGALTLYLDFINLFLMLLRLIGNKRD